MKFINRLMYNKKRAISPVIAVILLIGLAVAASAAIFIVILPLLEPTSNIQVNEAYVIYDTEYTTAQDTGQGYGKGLITVANTGTGEVEITSIKAYWATSFTEEWTEITDAISIQGITVNDPWVVGFSAIDDLSIRFPIPTENINNSLSYKIILAPREGRTLDTSRIDSVEETDMQLDADRPDISYTGSLGAIRTPLGLTKTVSPNSASDNSAVKNVTFEVYNGSGLVRTNTITSTSAWNWNWHTYLPSSQGLSNGTYTMKMTVYDYAGLSDFVNAGSFTIDNDYVKPNIESAIGSSIVGGIGVAEVGESYAVEANITDSGCGTSHVASATLYFSDNDTGLLKGSSSIMTQVPSTNTWYANVPASFIDSLILTEKLAFNINATDGFLNENDSKDYYGDVEDTQEPDFTAHTPVTIVTLDSTIDISATVTDEDGVDIVNLVWRHRNDTGLHTQYGSWEVLTNGSGVGNTWNFQITGLNATLDGIDYYLNATDLTGNIAIGNMTAFDGTPTSPYQITIPDVLSPEIILRTPTPVPEEHTADESLTVSVYVSDRDLTFSRTGNTTGTVELGYRAYPNAFTYIPMTHILGDSSTGSLGIWEGDITSGTFVATGFARVDFNIKGTDASTNEKITTDYSISVLPGGTPIYNYVANSLTLSGASDSILSFDVNNSAIGNPANGNITDVQVTLINRSKPASIGEPYLTQINVTGGSNPIWNNGSIDGGLNGSKLKLNNSFILGNGITTTMKMQFANSTGGYYNLENYKVNVTWYYEFSGTEYGTTSFILRTPGAEPDYISATPYSYNSRYYINSWIVSPLYPYGSNWGWQTEYNSPWTTTDYSLSDVAKGLYFISTEVSAPTGDSAAHTSSTGNDEWVYYTVNSYLMNLDTVTGGTDNHYLWLYAVVTLPPATYPNDEYTGMTVAMGSDDEAILYINGYHIAERTTPRGWSESGTTNTSVTLKGNGQNNYIIFGVHEDGGGYSGSVGIATSVPYTIKVYNQGPPAAPIRQSIGSSISFSLGESVSVNENQIVYVKNDIGIIPILEELRDSLKYCIVKLFNS